MPVTWNNATLSESGIGDPDAEQVLLASIMEHPEFAEYLDNFRPQEFTEYLHQRIAEGIQDLHRQGHTPDAIAVEDWLRQHNAISPHPSWDSEFYRPDKAGERIPILKDGKQQWFERRDLGLRGWHQVAGPGLPSIEYHGEIVRDNTITRMTTDAHLWAADRLKEAAAGPACDIAEKTSEISWRFNQMLSEQPKPLVSQFSDKEWVKHMEQAALTRSPSQSPALKYAQTPVTGPTQVQRSVVTMKVG